MIVLRPKFKIGWTIVRLFSVDVMNVIFSRKKTAELFGHHEPMLIDFASFIGHRMLGHVEFNVTGFGLFPQFRISSRPGTAQLSTMPTSERLLRIKILMRYEMVQSAIRTFNFYKPAAIFSKEFIHKNRMPYLNEQIKPFLVET